MLYAVVYSTQPASQSCDAYPLLMMHLPTRYGWEGQVFIIWFFPSFLLYICNYWSMLKNRNYIYEQCELPPALLYKKHSYREGV